MSPSGTPFPTIPVFTGMAGPCGRREPDEREPSPASSPAGAFAVLPAAHGGDIASPAAASPRGELDVEGSHRAARLAAGLNACRIAFRCVQLARESWQFSVAPEAFSRLLALHAEIGSGEGGPRQRGRVRAPRGSSC